MADDFNTSINWWDSTSSRTTRFDNTTVDGGGGGPAASVSTAADNSSADHIHMMGLGLSSHAMDWNQALLRGEKGTDHHQQQQGSFRSMLQIENLNSTPPGYEPGGGGGLWRERSSSSVYSSENSNSMNEFKQIARGFSLDQPAAVHDFCHVSTPDTSAAGFQLGSGGGGGGMFHGGELLGTEPNHHVHHHQHASLMGGGSSSSSNTSSSTAANFGIVGANNDMSSGNWSSSNKVPQFLRGNSPPAPKHSQLHFSNNAPFWNASGAMSTDVRPAGGFFPPSSSGHQQHQLPTFEDKPPKNIGEEGNCSSAVVVKKSEGGTNKRSRNETAAASTLPAFKVRKEKMGDRITALQQLVSPFGKTDTASVLSEAIEYIKFLHDQISVLSTPYMKSGAPIHHQQSSDHHHHQKSKDTTEAQKDLRSRGLCLVPVSSTFPVTHETSVDFWTPTFGGTFR
ncbi:Transcription factor bHLH123 [Linum grandiflorum]